MDIQTSQTNAGLRTNMGHNSKLNTVSEKIGPEQVEPDWLVNFFKLYSKLSIDNLGDLANIYDENIVFQDPLHKVEGYENLFNYFSHLYANLNYCNFMITESIVGNDCAAVYWVMDFSHPKLNSAKNITITGSSHLKSNGEKIIFHQDYLDAGAMLYEQLPFIGRIIKFIKQQAAL